MEGSQLRRSMTLSEQLSIEDSPSHKLATPRVAAAGDAEKQEAFAAGSGRRSVSSRSVSSRTLMDIIKEEQGANGGAAPGINWKSFKERLPLRRAGADASAAISDPEVIPLRPNPTAALGRSVSVRNAEMPFPGSTSRRRAIVSEYNHAATGTAAEEVGSDPPANSGSRGGEEEREGSEGSNRGGTGRPEAVPVAEAQPMRMSLMALLEQADRWGGEVEEEEAAAVEEEEIADEGDGGVVLHVCCVCMIRHKGAAFIPCGHTFCRLCSRELWVSRGNCPLCNGFILEILDIF